MTWLTVIQLLGPGLIALAGAWRASSKNARELVALRAEHVTCTRDLAAVKRSLLALRDELGLKRRDETAGGGSLLHVAAQDEPITRKQRKP